MVRIGFFDGLCPASSTWSKALRGGVVAPHARYIAAPLAGANASKEIEAVDSRCVAIAKLDLNGVIANGGGRVCFYFRLVHREQIALDSLGLLLFFALALIITSGARAIVAQIREIVMARVAV